MLNYKRAKTNKKQAVKLGLHVGKACKDKTGKNITLEPMTAFERKVIHTKLQENDKVTTYSVGEEPHRKVVVSLK